jgi:uncharacterized protein (TIGR03086 family)
MSGDGGLGPLEVYRQAVASFDEALHQVKDWQADTPCTEWDARRLVNHIVGEDLWLPPLLDGQTIEEVGSRFDGDLLGSEPLQAWSAASSAALAAAEEPGALDRTVQLSFGETAATEYVWQVAADHLIHSWDLAVASGADHRMDADVVASVSTWFAGNEAGYRAGGAIGERVEVGPDADAQTRLLAMFGRTPHVP